jgi:hypothetical protein
VDDLRAAEMLESAIHAPSRPVARMWLLRAYNQVAHAAGYLSGLYASVQRQNLPGLAAEVASVQAQAVSVAQALRALAHNVLGARSLADYQTTALYGFQADMGALYSSLHRLRRVMEG